MTHGKFAPIKGEITRTKNIILWGAQAPRINANGIKLDWMMDELNVSHLHPVTLALNEDEFVPHHPFP
jgi:hypothetical protein